MSAIAELSIFPLDQGEHLSGHVAKAVDMIVQSGLPYELGPMGTTFEGEWDEVLHTVERCMDAVTEDSCRVYLLLKVDYRSGAEKRMKRKVESVLSKIKD